MGETRICPVCEFENEPRETVCVRCRCHLYHNPFIGAFKKGFFSTDDKCPYPDHMGGRHGHVVTWSRSFRKYWQRGKSWQEGIIPSRVKME